MVGFLTLSSISPDLAHSQPELMAFLGLFVTSQTEFNVGGDLWWGSFKQFTRFDLAVGTMGWDGSGRFDLEKSQIA